MNTPEEAKKLIEIYSKAQQELIKTIQEKEARGNVTWYQKSLLQQITLQLQLLDKKAANWVTTELRDSYIKGMKEALLFLKNAGLHSGNIAFSKLHTRAIEALMNDALDELTGAGEFVNKKVSSMIRQAGIEAVTEKFTQGLTLQQCKKNLIKKLADQGVTGIESRNGRRLSLEYYASVVAKSKTREATNTGLTNQLTELGYDLVKMSSHTSSCRVCAPLQGRVYSISGKDTRYPPLSVAFTGPYANIHPNCGHTLMPYVEALALDPEGDRKFSNMLFDVDPRSQHQVDLYNEAQKKKQKLRANRRQWEKYKVLMPDITPSTFSGFMSMKRAGSEKWEQLQQEYKKLNKE